MSFVLPAFSKFKKRKPKPFHDTNSHTVVAINTKNKDIGVDAVLKKCADKRKKSMSCDDIEDLQDKSLDSLCDTDGSSSSYTLDELIAYFEDFLYKRTLLEKEFQLRYDVHSLAAIEANIANHDQQLLKLRDGIYDAMGTRVGMDVNRAKYIDALLCRTERKSAESSLVVGGGGPTRRNTAPVFGGQRRTSGDLFVDLKKRSSLGNIYSSAKIHVASNSKSTSKLSHSGV